MRILTFYEIVNGEDRSLQQVIAGTFDGGKNKIQGPKCLFDIDLKVADMAIFLC